MRVVFARTGTLETDTEHRQIIMNLEGSRYEQRDYNNPDDLTKVHDGITIGNFPLSISLDELFTKKQGRRKPEAYTYRELHSALKAKQQALVTDRENLVSTHDDEWRRANPQRHRAENGAAHRDQQAVFVFAGVRNLRADRHSAGHHGTASGNDGRFRAQSAGGAVVFLIIIVVTRSMKRRGYIPKS